MNVKALHQVITFACIGRNARFEYVVFQRCYDFHNEPVSLDHRIEGYLIVCVSSLIPIQNPTYVFSCSLGCS